MDADQLTLELAQDAPRRSMQRLVVHLDLFSGIGGFALAAKMVGGIKTIAFCEIDPWARRVLNKNFPGTPIHDDVRTLKPNDYGRIDLITGGFPCQPYSTAGSQGGAGDDRALWPEMLRVIAEAKPRWVLGENVVGIQNLDLERVLSDLEGIGYSCQAFDIPACGVSAKHARHRIWIMGYRNVCGICGTDQQPGGSAGEKGNGGEEKEGSLWEHIAAPTWGREGSSDQSPLVGRIHGVSSRLDRYRGVANAIVPQVAAEILRCMMRVDSLHNSLLSKQGCLDIADISDTKPQ